MGEFPALHYTTQNGLFFGGGDGGLTVGVVARRIMGIGRRIFGR
jgi:hypothetical protein